METSLFYLLGGVALIAAIGVVALRRVFYAALSLIVCLCALAGIYLLLDAPFIAAVQIILYAGAIMVLFLFIIMLLDPFSATAYTDKRKRLMFFGTILGAAALVMLSSLLRSYDPARAPHELLQAPGGIGSVANFARSLFGDYLLPFEATSVLILVAIIGAVVLAKRQT
jgi:NADH-quinone oxidoreductase subunit J